MGSVTVIVGFVTVIVGSVTVIVGSVALILLGQVPGPPWTSVP